MGTEGNEKDSRFIVHYSLSIFMKIALFVLFLFVPMYSFGQTYVWKTDYEKACERTGVVYSCSEQQVCSFQEVIKGKVVNTINVILYTYKELDSTNTIQDFRFSCSGFNRVQVRMNCSEIDSIISAIEIIMNNKDYMYIVNTGSMKICGCDDEGCIKIYYPTEGSMPGDFVFSYQYEIKGEELIKALKDVKAAM